jgi:hypothetical protein
LIVDIGDTATILILFRPRAAGAEIVVIVNLSRPDGDAGPNSLPTVVVSGAPPGTARLVATAPGLGATAMAIEIGSAKSGTVTFVNEAAATISTLAPRPGSRTPTFEIPAPVAGRLDIVPVPKTDGPTTPPGILSLPERENKDAVADPVKPPGGQNGRKRLNRVLLEVDPPPEATGAAPEQDDEDDVDEVSSDATDAGDRTITDLVFVSAWPLLDVTVADEAMPD